MLDRLISRLMLWGFQACLAWIAIDAYVRALNELLGEVSHALSAL